MKIALFALCVAVVVLVDAAPQKEGGLKEKLENFAAKFPKGKGGPDGAAPFDFKKFNQGLLEKGRAAYDGITGLDAKIDVPTFLEYLGEKMRKILEDAKVPAEVVEKIIKKQAEQVEDFVKKSDVVPTVGDVVSHLRSILEKVSSRIENFNPAEALENFKKSHSERARRSAEDSNDEDDESNDESNDDSSSEDVDTKKGKTNTQENQFQGLIDKVRAVIDGVTNLQDKLDVEKLYTDVFGKVKAVLQDNGVNVFVITIIESTLKDEVKKFVKQSTGQETVGDAIKYINAKVDELLGNKKDAAPVAVKQPIRKARSAEESDDDEVDEDSASSSDDVETKKGKKEKADKKDKKEKKEKKVKKHGKNQAEAEDEDATNIRERRAAGDNHKHGGAGQRNNTAQDGSENKGHGHGHGHHGKGNNSTSTDAGAGQPRGKPDFSAIAQAFGGKKGNSTKGGKGQHSRP